MTPKRIVILGALAVCSTAFAQTDAPRPRNNAIAYKCTNADGSVIYSQEPCSGDPKKVQTIDTSGALRTGSGGHQDEIAAGVADSDCRDKAYKSTHVSPERIDESNQHIAEYRQRRQNIEAMAANYGSPDPQTAKALDELDAAIAKESEFQQKEQGTSEQNFQTALRGCDEAQRTAAAKPAPPAAPPPPRNGGNDSGGD